MILSLTNDAAALYPTKQHLQLCIMIYYDLLILIYDDDDVILNVVSSC